MYWPKICFVFVFGPKSEFIKIVENSAWSKLNLKSRFFFRKFSTLLIISAAFLCFSITKCIGSTVNSLYFTLLIVSAALLYLNITHYRQHYYISILLIVSAALFDFNITHCIDSIVMFQHYPFYQQHCYISILLIVSAALLYFNIIHSLGNIIVFQDYSL